MIPADAPPSLDGHREATYALVHAVAPFYSVLMRVNPENPADTTNFVCDLCTAIPQPTDDGKTYTFKILTGVKFHDGSPLTAADVAASWHEIIFPRPGVLSARANWYEVVESVEAPDATTVVFKLKYRHRHFPAGARGSVRVHLSRRRSSTRTRTGTSNTSWAPGPFKFVSYDIGQSIKGVRNPDYYHKGLPYLDGFVGIFADKQAVRVDAIRADRAAMEFRGLPPRGDQRPEELAGRQDHGADQRLELRQPDHAECASASRSTTCGCARRCCWRSTSGTARRRCRRSPTCRPSAASCSPVRRWPPPRRSWRRWPASGRTSRSRAPRRGAC